MVQLTQSMAVWLFENHRDIFALIMFGHLELFTDEMKEEYLTWCKSEEGKQYLVGGDKYDPKFGKREWQN